MLALVRTPTRAHCKSVLWDLLWGEIPETQVRVLVENLGENTCFHINKCSFQLEDALPNGSSRSPYLG